MTILKRLCVRRQRYTRADRFRRPRWRSHSKRSLSVADVGDGWPKRYQTVQCWGAKSFVDDLVLSRGVVLSRAVISLRSIETKPFDSQICPQWTDTSATERTARQPADRTRSVGVTRRALFYFNVIKNEGCPFGWTLFFFWNFENAGCLTKMNFFINVKKDAGCLHKLIFCDASNRRYRGSTPRQSRCMTISRCKVNRLLCGSAFDCIAVIKKTFNS